MEQKDTENQHTKGFLGNLKDAWGILLPIYKDVIHNDPKRFIKANIANAGIGILWGGVAPWISGYALNAASEAVKAGVMNFGAGIAIAVDKLLKGMDSMLATYQKTNQEAFNYSGQQHRGIQRTREAANIPESAREQKNAKELSEYALENAKHEMELLNSTTEMAFYVPALIFGLTQSFIYNPAIGAAVAASVGINTYLSYRNAQKNKQDNAEFIQYNARFKANQRDDMDHSERVKALGLEEAEDKRLKELSMMAEDAMERRNRRYRLNRNIQTCIRVLTEIGLGVWSLSYATKTGNLGLMGALGMATGVATFSGMRMTEIIEKMRESMGKWYSTKQALSYEKSHELTHGDRTLDHVNGRLEVRGASYTYPGRTTPVLEGINLQLDKGLTVITGPSGGGKSTLLALLQHRREGEGQILLDGIPVTELSKGFLERQMTVVLQKPDYFEQRTLDENLDSVRSGLTEKEKIGALKSVGLYDEIGRRGLSQKISQFSGGQQQRENLAEPIARATPILIYDEPTANLDQINRRKNWKKLLEMSKNHTIIVVSHNAQEIESADRVICIEQGRISQDGSPGELAIQRGYVQTLLKDARRPLRLSPEQEEMQELNRLRQEALVGLKSKKKRDRQERRDYVLGPGMARSLMQATRLSDIDVDAVKAKISAFKKKQDPRSG